jgi:hypothetical protein
MYLGNMALQKAANWLGRNAKSNGNYTIVLGKDEGVKFVNFVYDNKTVSITMTVNCTDERSIRYNISKPDRSLITVGSGVTFTMEEGINLIGQQNYTRRMVSVNGGNFIMNGGSIKDNKDGGVIVLNGTFTMNGGSISGNASHNGGGVFMRNGIFTMNEGIITGNTATGTGSGTGGGGVYFDTGTFIIHNGTITGNSTARSGGGVLMIHGTFTMNNGTISENKADNRNGGGVHIAAGTFTAGTFTMNNGTIIGNSCKVWGGGVNAYGGTFTMNNGVISGNKAQFGGGVSSNGIFIKSGRAGIIYGSNAAANLANRASSNNNGHAVVLSDKDGNISKVRNSTAGANQLIDSRQSGTVVGCQ